MVTRLLATPLIRYLLVTTASSRASKPSKNSHPSPTCVAPSTPPSSTSNNNPNLNPYRCHYDYPSLFLQPPLPPYAALSPYPDLPQRMGTPTQNLFDGMLMKGRSVWGSF
ncbi:uncharacterized protein HKW66_Vig0205090 [Vigna angularis]|nr:uncharacterized protein HKW66_Vig0205090 [Vigna angularis]